MTISLKNDGHEVIETTANGSGSVEATFNAIDQFFNQSVKLDSYNIIAITEGIDAQAEVHVTVENNDTGAQSSMPTVLTLTSYGRVLLPMPMPTLWFNVKMQGLLLEKFLKKQTQKIKQRH